MINNLNRPVLFATLALIIGFAFIPQQVAATTSGYTCSDGNYDPREGSSSMPSEIYTKTYFHSWGVCKNGKSATAPVAAVTASGYTCSDGNYDPREGSSSMPSEIYTKTYSHSWGVCKNGTSATPSEAVADGKCNGGFLGFPAWYRGLTDEKCDIVSPGSDLGGFIWHVVLNILEMAIMAVVYITVFFILYGGFQFLTSQGAPDGMAKARTTILNAVIGLVISLVAVGIINFIVTGLLI